MAWRKKPGWRALLWSGLLSALTLCAAAAEKIGKKEGGKQSRREAAEQFFAGTEIPTLSFEISQVDMEQLRATQWSQSERPVVKATLREGAMVYTNVAVHLKGAAGSFQAVDQKPGFTLNMDKYAEGQRFHGLDKLSLNNSRQDPTYITDKLCRELYEATGVPVPRGNYVLVRLNNRDLGLYLLTEGWDKTFLKRFYKNTKGNLYDGGFAKDITVPKDVNSGENPEDHSDLQALAAAAQEPDLARRLQLLEKQLDLEKFITLMVVDAVLWNWDGYSMNRNNYRVYHDMDQDKMVFFPHGLDQMFWRPEGPVVPAMKGVVAKGAMQIPEVRQRYLARAAELLSTHLRLETLTNRVHALAARVQSALAASKRNREAADYDSELASLLNRIQTRMASVEQQLEGLKQLVKCNGREPVQLTSWEQRPESSLHLPGNKTQSKELVLTGGEARKVWATTLWLEEGSYRLEGRVKAEQVVPVADPDERVIQDKRVMQGTLRTLAGAATNSGGAGLRVWSQRKLTEGVEWNWFPFRESKNMRKRGLLPPAQPAKRLAGTADWTVVAYEFELKQTYADLHIIFDLLASEGKAALDASSVTIRKIK